MSTAWFVGWVVGLVLAIVIASLVPIGFFGGVLLGFALSYGGGFVAHRFAR